MTLRRFLPFALLLAGGCGDIDATGIYDLTFIDGPNECELTDWDPGRMRGGANTEILQDPATGEVRMSLGGAAAAATLVAAGEDQFFGRIGGNRIRADVDGMTVFENGACEFTWLLQLRANVNGDCMRGELRWRPQTNRDESCGPLLRCRNEQEITGCRPPPEE